MKEDLLFYNAYEQFYSMAAQSEVFKGYCEEAFGADFSQDGFSDLNQINTILSYIPKKSSLHILDIGCGNGKMLKYLQSKTDAYIHGFDYSEKAIETACMESNEKSDFRVGVIGEMEYPEELFDVAISMDSLYFAKDMSQFVGQIRMWLKEDGRFLIGYQEGDVMPKTENSETTMIARALRENHFRYQVTEITEETYRMLQRKRESILKYKEAFLNEGLKEWYEMVLGQTECATISLDEYRTQNARYLFVAEK
uniref:class I SAM-dependent methyltransferase n=1 Tax=Acetatifactor sp. TaxID=1872090 RepID=UPI004055AA4A